MNTSTDFLKRHSLIIGLLLMFLYTWTIDLSNSGVLPFKVPFAVPGGIVENMMVVLYIIVAIVVIVAAGPARLSRTEAMHVQE